MEHGAPATREALTRFEGVVRSVLAARMALLQAPLLLTELWSVVYAYANVHTLNEQEWALIRDTETAKAALN